MCYFLRGCGPPVAPSSAEAGTLRHQQGPRRNTAALAGHSSTHAAGFRARAGTIDTMSRDGPESAWASEAATRATRQIIEREVEQRISRQLNGAPGEGRRCLGAVQTPPRQACGNSLRHGLRFRGELAPPVPTLAEKPALRVPSNRFRRTTRMGASFGATLTGTFAPECGPLPGSADIPPLPKAVRMLRCLQHIRTLSIPNIAIILTIPRIQRIVRLFLVCIKFSEHLGIWDVLGSLQLILGLLARLTTLKILATLESCIILGHTKRLAIIAAIRRLRILDSPSTPTNRNSLTRLTSIILQNS